MAGKCIHQLREKADVLVEILHRAGRVDSATIGALAKGAGIKPSSFNYSLTEGRLTAPMELKLCAFGGFQPEEISWVDPDVSAAQRKDPYDPRYKGRDTAKDFRTFLLQNVNANGSGPEAISDTLSSADDTFLCHRIDVVGPKDGDAGPRLIFQSDFGHRYDRASGVRYAIRQARLDVAIVSQRGRVVQRLGLSNPFLASGAAFVARGTDRNPAWDIKHECTQSEALSGIYAAHDPSLAQLEDCSGQVRLETRMRVHFREGFIMPSSSLPPISDNQAVLIEAICASDFPTDRVKDGWIQLSEHDLTLLGAA